VSDSPLIHTGSGRPWRVLLPGPLGSAVPFKESGRRYVLVIAQQGPVGAISVEIARQWLNAGASYVCAWGPQAEDIEESFDYAAFLPELGPPLPFTLMTSNHAGQPLAEALRFALWDSAPPEDLDADLSLVVVQADSPAVAMQARAWLQSESQAARTGDA
jgi:hypothetical protein